MIKFILFALIACLFASCVELENTHPGAVTLSIVTVTDSSITLRWTQYSGDDFENYKVYYSTNDIVDNSSTLVDSLTFQFDTMKIVRPLTAGTHYYFRVIVNTVQGTFSASNTIDTNTLESMRGKLILYNPQNITDSSVTLNWSKCITSFEQYRIYANTSANVDTGSTYMKTVYLDSSTVIKGLLSNQAYWFRVYSFKDSTIVATSNIMGVTTGN